jgi:hypothetical protein
MLLVLRHRIIIYFSIEAEGIKAMDEFERLSKEV